MPDNVVEQVEQTGRKTIKDTTASRSSRLTQAGEPVSDVATALRAFLLATAGVAGSCLW